MAIEQDDVAHYLRHCSGSELSEILRCVFEARPETYDENTAFQYHLVFGVAARENIAESLDEIEWGPWEVALVAYRNPDRYPPDFAGEPFVQYGTCENCNVEVCSHVKGAICPLCDGSVWLT